MATSKAPGKKTERLKEAGEAAGASAANIVIEQPNTMRVGLEILGTADLIQNNFSQKGIEQMLRKHMGFSVQREKKKPREIIESAKILNTKGEVCVSPVAFKGAMISATTALKSLKKTHLRTQLFVEGQSIPITYDKIEPRMDIVRIGTSVRTPDVRFRPSFINWGARLIIQFSDLLSVQTIVDLLQRAGTVGVGEWRPEKNGTFGTFKVVRNITDADELAEVHELCATPLVRPTIPDWALDADIDPTVLAELADSIGAEEPGDGSDDEGPPPKRNGVGTSAQT